MEAIIVNEIKSETFTMREVVCGKHSVLVMVNNDGTVRVVVQNAANRVWKKFGKYFLTAEKAIANYKNASIRAAIAAGIGNLIAEAKDADLAEKFAGTCAAFQANVKATAIAAGMDHLKVYDLWRKYSQDCKNFDQSPIWSEFLDWNKAALTSRATA